MFAFASKPRLSAAHSSNQAQTQAGGETSRVAQAGQRAPALSEGRRLVADVLQRQSLEPGASQAETPPVQSHLPRAPLPGAGVSLSEDAIRRHCARHAHVIAFYLRFRDVALRVQESDGIPAAFTLAQMGFERGWRSSAREVGNNLFGVTARETLPRDQWRLQPTPVTVSSPDFERRDRSHPERIVSPLREFRQGVWRYVVLRPFRVFPSEEASVSHHTQLLQNDIYAAAWRHTGDPREFARHVAAAGYGGHAPAAIASYRGILLDAIGLIEDIAALCRDHEARAMACVERLEESRRRPRPAGSHPGSRL